MISKSFNKITIVLKDGATDKNKVGKWDESAGDFK